MRSLKLTVLIVVCVGFVTSVQAQQTAPNQAKKPTPAQVRMAIQGICPVSGQKLGAHGQPVLAKIGEEHIYLCCKGCLSAKVDPKHWATIHENFAKAQAICPIMKKPLPKSPKWTIVGNQIVYVCCPSCTDRIKADPKTALQTVDALYRTSLQKRISRR